MPADVALALPGNMPYRRVGETLFEVRLDHLTAEAHRRWTARIVEDRIIFETDFLESYGPGVAQDIGKTLDALRQGLRWVLLIPYRYETRNKKGVLVWLDGPETIPETLRWSAPNIVRQWSSGYSWVKTRDFDPSVQYLP